MFISIYSQTNTNSFAVRLRCQETELGQIFGTSVVTIYILHAWPGKKATIKLEA